MQTAKEWEEGGGRCELAVAEPSVGFVDAGTVHGVDRLWSAPIASSANPGVFSACYDPAGQMQTSPSYQALTIPYEPLPQLIERPAPGAHSSAPTPRRDIREWQDQIVKWREREREREVSIGFNISLIQTERTSKRPLRYPYKVTNFDPACHFYKSWAKAMDKDFVINPEWVSEKVKVTAATTDVGRLGKKSLPVCQCVCVCV
nr:hypothetical protein BaRGS_028711 [Batillaria attramentaria]